MSFLKVSQNRILDGAGRIILNWEEMIHAYNTVTPHLRIATWQNEDGHTNTYSTF